jgi:hypothetical protein
MHYAEFAEDEVRTSPLQPYPASQRLTLSQSQALLNAIKEYETNKWKVIGAKVGKPAKVRSPILPVLRLAHFILTSRQACEQYAKEHFAGRA